MSEFIPALKKIKERARSHMEKGAVTENYKADLGLASRSHSEYTEGTNASSVMMTRPREN
jgi:hypothetical protein